MTFGKPRFSKKYDWELIRFASLKGCNVIGAASKLFKHFLKNYPGNITTYANRRWSDGALYRKLGFEFVHYSSENYYYFLPEERRLYPRITFQAHKLANILTVHDPKLSESENVFNNGFRRIYDRGNIVFEYRR
jgi:hypothetical protein